MNKTFGQSLGSPSIGANIARRVRSIEMLRISARLGGESSNTSLAVACREVLKWAQARTGGKLPEDAWDLQGFDHLPGGRNIAAVRFQEDDWDVWALRAEDPDKKIPGRTWITEVVIGAQNTERPHLGLRLLASTAEPDFDPTPHVPGLMRQLAEKPGLFHDTERLVATPRLIESEDEAEALCEQLEDPERRLPIFAVTILGGISDRTLISETEVAKATTGIAIVARLSLRAAWVLTDRFGKEHSVFRGAVRAYMPGFSKTDDPYRHRLFLANRLGSDEEAKCCEVWLHRTATKFNISGNRRGEVIKPFSTMRAKSQHLQRKQLHDNASNKDEIIDSLKKDIKELEQELQGYADKANKATTRAKEAGQQLHKLSCRCKELEKAMAKKGREQPSDEPLPRDWKKFIGWLNGSYVDRVVLTSNAKKMLRSSPEFEDVKTVAKAIRWLATEYFDQRINGGGDVKGKIENLNGLENTRCGGDSYKIKWRGKHQTVDWHIKNGGNTRNPKRCLRIYYFWEDEDNIQQIVIDHLPSHR